MVSNGYYLVVYVKVEHPVCPCMAGGCWKLELATLFSRFESEIGRARGVRVSQDCCYALYLIRTIPSFEEDPLPVPYDSEWNRHLRDVLNAHAESRPPREAFADVRGRHLG